MSKGSRHMGFIEELLKFPELNMLLTNRYFRELIEVLMKCKTSISAETLVNCAMRYVEKIYSFTSDFETKN